MRRYGQSDVLGALREQQAELEQALAERRQLTAEHMARRTALTAQVRAAGMDLAALVLPELTPETQDQAKRLTGMRLRDQNPIAEREAERTRMTARLAEIDADPRWRDRDLLRAPRVGTLARKLDELNEFRAPAAQLIELAAHPRLLHLVEVGYGSDAYAVPFWRWSYYQDWKAGDEILERFEGKKTFAELVPELRQAFADLPVFDRQISEVRAEIEAGERLAAERTQLTDRLERWDTIYLEGLREKMVAYLSTLEPGDLAGRLANEPDVALAWKRFSGLAAQERYLETMRNEKLLPAERALEAEIQKAQRAAWKWQRAKMAHASVPETEWNQRYARRRGDKLRRSLERDRETYDTVARFDRWDRADLTRDLLWWDVMTDGRLDGDFVPEVRGWRESHPDYRWERGGLDDGDAAAAAVSAAHGTGGGFDHAVDPS